MDIFDFIKGGLGKDIPDSHEVISINIPRDDMKEFIVIIAINIAMIGGILKDYRDKMSRTDVLKLENTLHFGMSMVTMLSLVTGITQKELVEELTHFMTDARTETAQKMKIHMNKSKEDIDSFTLRMFGNKDT